MTFEEFVHKIDDFIVNFDIIHALGMFLIGAIIVMASYLIGFCIHEFIDKKRRR